MRNFIKNNFLAVIVLIVLYLVIGIGVIYSASITAKFPASLNTFSEGDIIEEEDWNAIEAEIGTRIGNVATGTRETINWIIRNGSFATSSIKVGDTATSTISGTATSTIQNGLIIAAQGLTLSDYINCNLDTDSSGNLVCGTDSTGSSTFDWTVESWGNSTSTTLGFLNGFLSTASSTIDGNLLLTGTLTGSSAAFGTGTQFGGDLISSGSYPANIGSGDGSNDWTNIYLGGTDPSIIQAVSVALSIETVGTKNMLFKPNEVERMRITSDGYVGIGTTTPAYLLDVGGIIAQSGIGNSTFIGKNAGLSDDLTDNRNVFIGDDSGRNNTTGIFNTGVGYNSMFSNISNSGNSGFGYQSLFNITTGFNNVGVGRIAGSLTTAAASNQTSDTSVYLGYDSRPSADGNSNEIVIGSEARGLGSNSVVLGNSSILTTILRSDVGIGTTSPYATLSVDINGTLAAPSSLGGRSITVNGTALDTDIELYTFSKTVALATSTMSTTTTFARWKAPVALTLTEIACDTNSGTSTIKIDIRASGTPTTAGTAVLFAGGLVCGSGFDIASTTFNTTAVTAGQKLNFEISDAEPTGSKPSQLNIYFKYTHND